MQWSKHEKITKQLKCFEWNEEKCDAPLVLFVLLWLGIIVTKGKNSQTQSLQGFLSACEHMHIPNMGPGVQMCGICLTDD